MADINSTLAFKIQTTGDKELINSLQRIDAEQKKLAGTTRSLNGFVREQRAEQRQQSFLFRESKDLAASLTFSIVALTSATGSASKAQQDLNSTLVSTYTGFQAADFALSAFGVATGGIGLAIKGAVGAGLGLLTFLDKSNEKAKKAAEEGLKLYADMVKSSFQGVSFERAKHEAEVYVEVIRKLNEDLEKDKKKPWTPEELKDFDPFGYAQLGNFSLAEEIRKAESKGRKENIRLTQDEINQKKDLIEKYGIYKKEAEALVEAIDKLNAAEKRRRGEEVEKRKLLPIDENTARLLTFDELDAREAKREGLALARSKREENERRRRGKGLDDEEAKLDKLNNKQMNFVATLGSSFSSLSSGLSGLGVKADSVIMRLISAAEAILSIAKAIQVFSTLANFASGGTSGAFSAIGSAVSGVSKSMGTPTTTGSTVNSINVNLNFSALDTSGAEKVLRNNRKALMTVIEESVRRGIR